MLTLVCKIKAVIYTYIPPKTQIPVAGENGLEPFMLTAAKETVTYWQAKNSRSTTSSLDDTCTKNPSHKLPI